MEYCISAIWISLELLSLYYVCRAFMPQREGKLRIISVFIIVGLINLIVSNFPIPFLSSIPLLKNGLLLAICVLMSVLSFVGQWYTHVTVIILFYFGFSAIDTLVFYAASALLGISGDVLIYKKWMYVMTISTGKCFSLFLAWMIFRLRSGGSIRRANRKTGKSVLLAAIFPVVSIIMLYIVYDSYKNQADLSTRAVVFSVILIIANFVIIYLLDSLQRASQAEQEVVILNQSMTLQTENYKALEKSYRAQRKSSHEFRHQLQVLYELLENEEYPEAKDYINELQVKHTSRILVAKTNHPIIDAILNEKYQVATENNIDISFKVNDLSEITISTDALVVVLSNILDNAIEACLRLPSGRRIECSVIKSDNLLLSVKNSSPPVSIVQGRIKTEKKPEREHGFGLVSVQRILKQCNAEYVIDYSDNMFRFVAEIPL